jgi:uncharacterized protein with von Willebrand factor type A (vWA) domain
MLPALHCGGLTSVAEDVAGVAARFGAALRGAGLPVGPDRCERFARAVTVARPTSLRELRECALATMVSSREHADRLLRVFEETFGGAAEVPPDGTPVNGANRALDLLGQSGQPAPSMIDGDFRPPGGHQFPIDQEVRDGDGASTLARAAQAAREHASADISGGARTTLQPAVQDDGAGEADEPADGEGAERRVIATEAERLAGTDFAELTPAELALLAGVMRRLTLSLPMRRSRRQRRGPRGREADLRATLRHARKTGGHPFGIIKKNPTRRPRKLVVLCDISGSMEPYARAMLQLLYCAAGGARAEVFCFATRLTRLTKALAQAQPGLALQHAGRAAPDWLGGTRIGASLKEFNDGFGQRGLARGAVVVVVSDGWDTGDPATVRREMERLSRLAFRIVWVNPRSSRPGYQPLAGGMAAALPYCDAVVSAHRLDALGGLTAALADPVRRRHPSPAPSGRAA